MARNENDYTEQSRIEIKPEDLSREKLIELTLQPLNQILNGEATTTLEEYRRLVTLLYQLKGYDKEIQTITTGTGIGTKTVKKSIGNNEPRQQKPSLPEKVSKPKKVKIVIDDNQSITEEVSGDKELETIELIPRQEEKAIKKTPPMTPERIREALSLMDELEKELGIAPYKEDDEWDD